MNENISALQDLREIATLPVAAALAALALTWLVWYFTGNRCTEELANASRDATRRLLQRIHQPGVAQRHLDQLGHRGHWRRCMELRNDNQGKTRQRGCGKGFGRGTADRARVSERNSVS